MVERIHPPSDEFRMSWLWLVEYFRAMLRITDEDKKARFVAYANTKGWREALDGEVSVKRMKQVVAYSEAEIQRAKQDSSAPGAVVEAPATLMRVLMILSTSITGEQETMDGRGMCPRCIWFMSLSKMLKSHAEDGNNMEAIVQGRSCFNAMVGKRRVEAEYPAGTDLVLTLQVVNGGLQRTIEIPVDKGLGMLGMMVGE